MLAVLIPNVCREDLYYCGPEPGVSVHFIGNDLSILGGVSFDKVLLPMIYN